MLVVLIVLVKLIVFVKLVMLESCLRVGFVGILKHIDVGLSGLGSGNVPGRVWIGLESCFGSALLGFGNTFMLVALMLLGDSVSDLKTYLNK